MSNNLTYDEVLTLSAALNSYKRNLEDLKRYGDNESIDITIEEIRSIQLKIVGIVSEQVTSSDRS